VGIRLVEPNQVLKDRVRALSGNEIVAFLPGSSALLYLWFGQPKNLNKNPVTLMNADKTG